jgi:hypothetical protein
MKKYKVGDKVRYIGGNNFFQDLDELTIKVEVSDRYYFEETCYGVAHEDLELVAEKPHVGLMGVKPSATEYDKNLLKQRFTDSGVWKWWDEAGDLVDLAYLENLHNNHNNNNNKNNMNYNTIKNTMQRMRLTKPEKQLVEAGLMNSDKTWRNEAIDFAYDKMRDDFMATKEFRDELLKVAEALIEENK